MYGYCTAKPKHCNVTREMAGRISRPSLRRFKPLARLDEAHRMLQRLVGPETATSIAEDHSAA